MRLSEDSNLPIYSTFPYIYFLLPKILLIMFIIIIANPFLANVTTALIIINIANIMTIAIILSTPIVSFL